MNECGASGVGLCVLLAAVAAWAASQTIPVPATLNQSSIGELNVQLSETGLLAVQSLGLRPRLAAILVPGRLASLPTEESAWISPAQLQAAGVRVEFDFQNLILHLAVPPELRRVETVNLMGTPVLRADHVASPADFSAFLNIRGGLNLVERSDWEDEGFRDPQWALESALNWHGWVLENEAAVNPTPSQDWQKRDSRLVFDQPERRLRWTAGDLNYPVTSFQSFVPMAGLALHREATLQPYRITSPLGQSAFQLKEDSKVEVLVNGHVVRTLQLNAGPHLLSNFPLAGGANNVVLRITDPVGRVEYINATFYYEARALRRGETEFNLAFGFPSRLDPESPFYEYQTEPLATGFLRWGLTDSLTAGLNAQGGERAQMGGSELILSTGMGSFSLEAALTHGEELDWGHVERLQYRYYAPPESPLRNGVFSLEGRHASESYGELSPFSRSLATGDRWDWQVRYSQNLTDWLSAGGAYAEELREDAGNLRSASLSLAFRFGRVSAEATVRRGEGRAGAGEWAGYFSLLAHLGRGVSSFASYDTLQRTTRAEVQYNPLRNVSTFSGALGLQDVDGKQDIYGNARYYGRRLEAMFSQYSNLGGDHRASLTWGTALVYADGEFGVSRPVRDAFAIFDSAGSLRDSGGLGLQPQGDYYSAKEDWLGPAVLPELTAYYQTQVRAEPLQAAPEFDPQDGDWLLRPTYHSGIRVRLGRPAAANATAELVWADGSPAALQSGSLTAEDGGVTGFITNREGVTFFNGLRSGSYRGALDAHPEAPFTIVIPSDFKESVDLGRIQIPTTE